MAKVAILDDYQKCAMQMADWNSLLPGVKVQAFQDHLSDQSALVQRLLDFEIIVAMRERTPFPRSVLEQLFRLQWLVTSGKRNASIDLQAASDRGVLVCGTGGQGHPAAELAWGLILACVRHIAKEDRATREGNWQTSLGMGLEGRVLGVVGLGRLGSHVATVAKAFGMSVLAWSQNLTAERATQQGARLASKEELLSNSDVVTIHLVLSDRTRGLIGARELRLMKPTAYLVNTSRGPIVDEKALVEALQKKTIAGAGLDVFDEEPLAPDNPFLSLDNVVITPHLGYVTIDNYRVFYGQALEAIQAYLKGSPIRTLNSQSKK